MAFVLGTTQQYRASRKYHYKQYNSSIIRSKVVRSSTVVLNSTIVVAAAGDKDKYKQAMGWLGGSFSQIWCAPEGHNRCFR